MATTQRRRSLSLPFGNFFSSRSEPKAEVAPPLPPPPRLRRKLQKLSKSKTDSDTGIDARPLTLYSDGSFLSIRYDERPRTAAAAATRPSTAAPAEATRNTKNTQSTKSYPPSPARPPVSMQARRSLGPGPGHAGNPAEAPRTTFRCKARSAPAPIVVPPPAPQQHAEHSAARHSMAASLASPSMTVTSASSASTTSHMSSMHAFLPPSPPWSSSSNTPPSSACSFEPFKSSSPLPQPLRPHQPIQTQSRDAGVVPELSYLSRADRPEEKEKDGQYSAGTTTPPLSPESCALSVASGTQTRRKPKTPVYTIGQLEQPATDQGIQTPPESPQLPAADTAHAELTLLQSQSSIECIAEQYRALLASRNSMFSMASVAREDGRKDAKEARPAQRERHFVLSPPPPRKERAGSVAGSMSTMSPLPSPAFPVTAAPAQAPVQAPVQAPPRQGTPSVQKSHGPMVHKHHTSFFTPLAAQPERSRPVPSQHSQPRRPLRPLRHSAAPLQYTPSLDNPGLQVCVDLLTRELSSAMERPMPGGAAPAPASALQVLVMIEAYERLRDDMVAASRQRLDGSSAQVEAMFSLWLRSLYEMHDRLTAADGGTRGSRDDTSERPSSESEYEA